MSGGCRSGLRLTPIRPRSAAAPGTGRRDGDPSPSRGTARRPRADRDVVDQEVRRPVEDLEALRPDQATRRRSRGHRRAAAPCSPWCRRRRPVAGGHRRRRPQPLAHARRRRAWSRRPGGRRRPGCSGGSSRRCVWARRPRAVQGRQVAGQERSRPPDMGLEARELEPASDRGADLLGVAEHGLSRATGTRNGEQDT